MSTNKPKIPQMKVPNIIGALKSIENLQKVRQTEIYLPGLKTSVLITPLTGADDMMLKTQRTSVQKFNKILSELMYKHVTFTDPQIVINNVDDFDSKVTLADKPLLYYGLLDATFEKLPTKPLNCPHCGARHEASPFVNTMLQEDSITENWDKDVPIYEYTEVVSFLDGAINITFGIATTKDSNDVTDKMSAEKMKNNVENDGSITDINETIAMFTKKIKVIERDENGSVVNEWDDITDKVQIVAILKSLQLSIHEQVLDVFNEKFNKFIPKFYIPFTCESCSQEYVWHIRPETEFFRKIDSI